MKKKLTNLFLVAAFLVFGFGSASAFPLFSGTPASPGTAFEDDNRDFLMVDLDNDGIIDVDDVLISLIEFTRVIDQASNPDESHSVNMLADELVAISIIQLASVDTFNTWHFKQYGATPMVQVYTTGPNDTMNLNLDADPTLINGLAAITEGTHLWDFSITSDPDTFWVFSPVAPFGATAADTANVRTLGSTTKVGSANYALNQVWGNDIFDPVMLDAIGQYYANANGDKLVDMIGSGDILGGNDLVNAFARSDVDVQVNPSTIPEPATMTLFGIGLLSLAAVARRRKE